MSELCWEKSSCGIGPCGLPKGHEGLHELSFRGGLARWKDGERPVSPATTAEKWIDANRKFIDDMVSIEEAEDIPDLAKVLSAYLKSQSEKLVGIGQEAAEKIAAMYDLKGMIDESAAIIEKLVAERLAK